MSLRGVRLLVTTAVLGACGDLALEPNRVPTSLEIVPDNGLVTEGEPARLDVIVRDQNGEAMPGPPSWALPEWTVTDPSAVEIARDGTVNALGGGDLRVTASVAGLAATTRLRVNPSQVALSAPVIYLTQGAQGIDGTLPLIAGRQALLRVFATGHEVSFYEPKVRVTFLQEDHPVFEDVLVALSDLTPLKVEESRIDRSFNGRIPGSVLQPGVRMVVDLDPEGVVPLAPGSRTRFPAEGSMALNVVETPILRQIMVPTIQDLAPNEDVFNWTDGISRESRQLRLAQSLLPIGAMEVEVHETFHSGSDLRTEEGWGQWITEVRALFEIEGRRGYYYGVTTLPPGSSYGGLGYVGYPVSVGATSEGVYAHELGHNMALFHAPCGGAGGADPDYPYEGGSSGIWGYDFFRGQLIDPGEYKDLMGYCSPDWISDYHFKRAFDHRLDRDGGVSLNPVVSSRPVLVVWGSVRDGHMALEPSFLVKGPVSLPEADGPYRVDGLGVGGQTEFSLSFSPTPLEFGGGSFVFLVPYEPNWAGTLDRLVLTGPEGSHTMTRSSASPMAVVTDRSTGRIRAIIREWDGRRIPGEAEADVTITMGVPESGLR